MPGIIVHVKSIHTTSVELNTEEKVELSILAVTHLLFQMRVLAQAVAYFPPLIFIAVSVDGLTLMEPSVYSN